MIEDFNNEIIFLPLLKLVSILSYISRISNLSVLAVIWISWLLVVLNFLIKSKVNGILKTFPFRLNKFDKFSLSQNRNAFDILIIAIVSFELSLKKILLLLILIFLLENILSLLFFNNS